MKKLIFAIPVLFFACKKQNSDPLDGTKWQKVNAPAAKLMFSNDSLTIAPIASAPGFVKYRYQLLTNDTVLLPDIRVKFVAKIKGDRLNWLDVAAGVTSEYEKY